MIATKMHASQRARNRDREGESQRERDPARAPERATEILSLALSESLWLSLTVRAFHSPALPDTLFGLLTKCLLGSQEWFQFAERAPGRHHDCHSEHFSSQEDDQAPDKVGRFAHFMAPCD